MGARLGKHYIEHISITDNEDDVVDDGVYRTHIYNR